MTPRRLIEDWLMGDDTPPCLLKDQEGGQSICRLCIMIFHERKVRRGQRGGNENGPAGVRERSMGVDFV